MMSSSQACASARRRPRPGAFSAALFFALMPAAAAGGALALATFQALLAPLALIGAPIRSLLPRSRWVQFFLLFLFSFVIWAAVTSLWSPYPDRMQAARALGGYVCGVLFVAGAGAVDANRRLVRAAGAAGLIVLTALLLIEALAGLPLNSLAQPDSQLGFLARNANRGMAVLICLVWAGVAALAGGGGLERFAWRALIAGAAIVSFQLDMNVCALAFGVGLLAYAIGHSAPRFAIMALCAGLALWLLAAPWAISALRLDPALLDRLPPSWAHRVEIWRYAAAQIEAQPWIGWGMDAARTFEAKTIVQGQQLSLISLHPHSFSLHVWLETGAVGAGLGALALAAGGFAASRALGRDRRAAAGACGALAAFGLIANLSFGAWQEWWVATAFAAAALVNAARR